MNMQLLCRAALDPAAILQARGFQVDPWQMDLLRCANRQILLNGCRQSGKSTAVSALALHAALFLPGSLTLILSPGLRQSCEIFRKIGEGYRALRQPVKARYASQYHLELENHSRIISLPGREETIRGYSGVSLLIIDEASRVPDDLYRSVRPLLAVSRGRLVALSTPFGQRGWFFEEWTGGNAWKRVKVTWRDCPRITQSFVDDETRAMGPAWVDQEYNCLFTALEGLVYPDFEITCVPATTAPLVGKKVGGIDWGWRNPFAAIWGVLDHDDVLWLQEERYLRETPLHEHCKALPKILWYADPAGRTEIEEFRSAGHTVRQGFNDVRLGIAAVTARLRTGRLKIDPNGCPNLVAEARLYRYPAKGDHAGPGENPVDQDNHALGALRYLVSRLDQRFIARLRKQSSSSRDGAPETTPSDDAHDTSSRVAEARSAPAGSLLNNDLWTTVN